MKQTILAACAGVLTVSLLGLAPAQAAVPPMPGSFTGYAFDTCEAPTQAQMDDLRTNSPFWGVGVYIAGANRFCEDQSELDATWVSTQAKKGWRILPITVGRQASCSTLPGVTTIDPDKADEYAAARAQGRREADKTIEASKALGLARGTTQWIDIEDFDVTRTHCRRSMLAFVSGWTKRLHGLGYRSGLYSNAAAGIQAVEGARTLSPGSYVLPDQIWFAHENGEVTVDTSYVADDAWKRQRIHQYLLDETQSYGSTTLQIDLNWMDIGGGTRAGKAGPHCGVRIDFPTYPTLSRGDTGPRVTALQCLLTQQGYYDGPLNGRYGAATAQAVKAFRTDLPTLDDTGVTDQETWTALLSAGSRVFTKVGAGADHVRRLQRALNAATSSQLTISGIFDRPTEAAVKAYQAGLGLTQTGVVTVELWTSLQAGLR